MAESKPKLKRKSPWRQVIVFSLPWILLLGGYYSLSSGVYGFQHFLIKGIIHTGFLLISFSLLLGTLAKFFDRFDKYLHYRKQLGIVGFFYGSIHGVLAPILYLIPTMPVADRQLQGAFAGLIALALFYVCAYISSIPMIRKLGSARWRKTIRYTSYTAYTVAIVHIFLFSYPKWLAYGASLSQGYWGLPPMSLFTFLLGVGVITWRFGVMWYDIIRIAQTKKSEAPSSE